MRVDRGRFGALLENLWKWVCGAFESLISSSIVRIICDNDTARSKYNCVLKK